MKSVQIGTEKKLYLSTTSMSKWKWQHVLVYFWLFPTPSDWHAQVGIICSNFNFLALKLPTSSRPQLQRKKNKYFGSHFDVYIYQQ